MQISHRVYSQVQEEGAVWAGATGVGAGAEGIGPAKGERDNRGALDGRSCAHAGVDTAEVLGGAGAGIREGQECYSHSTGVCWAEEEFCGPAFLGTRVLGIDRGQERSGGAPLHPGAGERGPAVGSAGANAALSGSRKQLIRFERFTLFQASGFAGGR